MAVKYEFDYEELEELMKRVSSIGESSEEVINQVLKREAKDSFEPAITNLIPVSKKKKGPHARTSKWSKIKNGHLEVTIATAGGAANNPGSFGYLVFPDQGIGKRNPQAQNFFQEGRDLQIPHLIEVTQFELLNKLEEVL